MKSPRKVEAYAFSPHLWDPPDRGLARLIISESTAKRPSNLVYNLEVLLEVGQTDCISCSLCLVVRELIRHSRKKKKAKELCRGIDNPLINCPNGWVTDMANRPWFSREGKF